MKIALITNHLNSGGITSYCLLISRLMSAKGYKVVVISGGGNCEEQFTKYAELIRLPINTSSEVNPKIFFASFKLRKILSGFDVVHLQTRVSQVLYYWSGLKIPSVFTCHGFLTKRIGRLFFPLWPTSVIAISEAVKKHLIDEWKMPANHIKVIKHGVEALPDISEEEREVLRREFNAAPDDILYGAFGRYSPVKGYHVLVEAVSKLSAKLNRFKLYLAGSGPEESRLKSLIQIHKLEKNVFLIPGERGSTLMRSCDFFCAPSLQEGLGLSVMEAMANGVPVLGSKAGGINELVEEGVNGWLAEPGSVSDTARLLSKSLTMSKEQARLAGRRGKELLGAFYTPAEMADKTAALYRELV